MVLYYEDIEDKDKLFKRLSEWQQIHPKTTLYVSAQTFLNESEIVEICEKCKYIGCEVEVSEGFFNEVFNSSENTQNLIQNYFKAQQALGKQINFEAGFTIEQVQNAQNWLNGWVGQINFLNCNGASLSPLEKYVACYELATDYSYKLEESDENENLSRSLPFVLDPNNNKICCAGFSNLLSALANRCGIDCLYESITYKNKVVGHAVCAVKMEDEKYGLDTVFRADPTFGGIMSYGRTLAGIWRSYKTISKYHTSESTDYNSEIQKQHVLEKVTQEKASDINVKPHGALNSDDFDRKNYIERLKLFIYPVLDEVFEAAQIKSDKQVNMLNASEDLHYFCTHTMPSMFLVREREIANIVNNTDLTEAEANEQYEKQLSEFNKYLKEKLTPVCSTIKSLFPLNDNNAKSFFMNFIDNLEYSADADMFRSNEEEKSQNFLFKKQVESISQNISPYLLATAVKNVALARGLNIVEACRYSADILTRSAMTELNDLRIKKMLDTDEVFSVLLQEPLISKTDIEKFDEEELENCNNNILRGQTDNPDLFAFDSSARINIEQKIYTNLNYGLLAEAINQANANPQLQNDYALLFEEYPTLKGYKETITPIMLQEIDSGALFVQNPPQNFEDLIESSNDFNTQTNSDGESLDR